jgi:hypothetical protein
VSLRLGQYGTLLVTYLRPQWVRVVVLSVMAVECVIVRRSHASATMRPIRQP